LAGCRDPKIRCNLHVALATRAAGPGDDRIVRRAEVGSGGKLIAIACALACLAPAAHGRTRRQRGAKTRVAKDVRTVPDPPVERGTYEEHVHVRRGDTLDGLLIARGVGASEARPWLAAARTVYDLRRLQPRHGLTLRFDRATHALEAVHYEMDDRSLLVLERVGDRIHAERAALPYFTEVKGAAARIEHGFREDATAAGIPEPVVSALADIFGWELDPATDLAPGDELRVLYENTWQTGGAHPEPGNVVGARLVTRGRSLTAIFFEDGDGNGAYYTPAGEPLSREFLRYPLEFTDITSEFSMARSHPILHRARPHLGVDFAAPPGTPVRAVANGVVTEAGWAGELGRCVRLEHAGTLTSV
jgi:murein DD-endopeptidase MepM/ murein hydrolase activator NlpD